MDAYRKYQYQLKHARQAQDDANRELAARHELHIPDSARIDQVTVREGTEIGQPYGTKNVTYTITIHVNSGETL